MNALNRQLITHSEAMERFCASVSDETAHVLLKLAREITSSPLGDGGGDLAHAQRLLEDRLGVSVSENVLSGAKRLNGLNGLNIGKSVIIEGSPGFQRLIAEVAGENFLPGESQKRNDKCPKP